MKVALIGYGKMGHEIEKILLDRGHQIILIIDKDNQPDIKSEKFKAADVAIEFTTPHSAIENIKASTLAGVPLVCGSTGWLDRLPEMEAFVTQNNGGLFYASNFSLGVNIFFHINEYLAKIMAKLKDYSVEMEECHHNQKLDAPSGTAITLAEHILKEYPQEYVKNKNIPYYPIFTQENQNKYNEYLEYSKEFDNLILLGRLAEYKYYDMDDMVERVLEVFKREINV